MTKTKSRLFTFGCSFTMYAWPTYADFLGYSFDEYENWAFPGLGNRAIAERIAECHVKNKFTEINDVSYVGTMDNGIGFFDQEQTFTIVTCSHVRKIKRLDLLVNILNQLKFDVIWHMIGDGSDLEKVKCVNKKLKSNVSVIYHGSKKRAEILEFYKLNHINLFISLSFSEGLPVSMIEAISYGIPLMSTDVGGCNEICNEQTGFLIPLHFDNCIVSNQISEFRKSSKNTIKFRLNCRKFWNENFNAIKNYNNFSKKIIALKP